MYGVHSTDGVPNVLNVLDLSTSYPGSGIPIQRTRTRKVHVPNVRKATRHPISWVNHALYPIQSPGDDHANDPRFKVPLHHQPLGCRAA